MLGAYTNQILRLDPSVSPAAWAPFRVLPSARAYLGAAYFEGRVASPRALPLRAPR